MNLESNFLQFNFGMDNASKHSIYGFDRFRLDVDKLMLYNGGSAVQLPPKCVNTLAVLVENAGEIISKDDLIDAVWKDSIVEESNLSQYLYLLRKTLGSLPDGQPYIETLRRRGYRFNGEPALIDSQPKPKPQRTPRIEPPRVGNFNAEPRGNVVALAEWKEPEQIRLDTPLKIALAPQPPALTVARRWPLAAAMFALLFISGAGYFFYSRSSAAPVPHQSETTTLRLTNGLEIFYVTISLDGKYFVYTEHLGTAYKLWIQQTGHSSRVEIIPASKKAICCTTFSPDGQFVYYVEQDAPNVGSSLYRVPTLGGPTTKILSGIQNAVSFSPDGREMVYQRPGKQNGEIEFVIRASDGAEGERIIFTSLALYVGGVPAWSPDGKTIVFARSEVRETDAVNLVVTALNVADATLVPISDEKWDGVARTMWSRDGRGIYFIGTRKGEGMTPGRDQLYYVSYPEGRSRRVTNDGTSRQQWDSLGVTNDGSVLTVPFNRASQIWAMDANGDSRSAVQLTSGFSDGRAGLAPLVDGRLAYVTRSANSISIWVMNQDGSDQKPLVVDPPKLEELRSSRAGRHLVYSAPVNGSNPHLFRIDPDGTNAKQLTFGEGHEVDSSISNDGNWVAYGNTLLRGTNFEYSLWKVPINGGEPVRLKLDNCEMPHFSPEDKYLSCVEGQTTIHILSADDGALLRSLPALPNSTLNSGARWAPDGKSVAYIVTEKGVSNIWLHPIEDGEPKRLTDFTIASIYNFAFSVDGTRLFIARGQQIRDAVLIKGAG